MKNFFKEKVKPSLCHKRRCLLEVVLCLTLLTTSPLLVEASELQSPKITLNVERKSIKEVIEIIKSKTDYLFFIDTKDVDLNKLVTINVSDSPVESVMETLLKNSGAKYTIRDKHIVVYSGTENLNINAKAQDPVTVTGVIIDGEGIPIIGASVIEKGTTNGTISDIDGRFSINASGPEAVLTFSYIGYITQDHKIGNRRNFNITLQENVQELEAVVVVGYGTMRKKDLTGSIAQVRPDKLASESPTTIQDVLRSGVPGLNIGVETSAKGGGDMQIRGQRSLNAKNDPLIVVDNMVFFGELSEINPQDIEQIDVLKDASSAAIYGAKSANGVVIITTKRGKTEKPVIRFDASLGVVTMGAHRKVYDADGYLNFRSDWFDSSSKFENPWKYARPTAENLSKYGLSIDEWRGDQQGTDEEIWLDRLALFDQEKYNYFNGRTYDWYDASFQTGLRQDYNASVSGMTGKANYYLSFGYLNSKGIVKGDEYETFRSNIKVDATVNDFLTIGANINFQNRTDGNLAVDWKKQITANSPYALPYDEEGNLVLKPMGTNSLNEGWNYEYERQFKSLDKGYTIFNTILTAKVKLPFNIRYTFSFAPRFQWFHDRYHESSQHPQWKEKDNGAVNREQTKKYDWLLNNVINWEQTFAGKHNVNITLSQEAEEHLSWKDRIEARDFTPTDVLGYHYIQPADKLKSKFESNDMHSTGDALLARGFYSYDNRYMTTLSVRRDGFSAFGASNPRATFTSVALAWSFANESFFKWDKVSYGKLRLSWGSNGNRGLEDVYTALSNLTTGSGSYGYIGAGNSLKEISQLYVERMANLNLRWEKTTSWNLGLDFGFLDQRINGSLEFYHMPTTDLIMDQTLPDITGFKKVTTNLGEVVNKGFELTINSTNIRNKDFEWNSTFNFSLNRNKIKHLYYTHTDVLDANGNVIGSKEVDDPGAGWFIGKDINEIWHYKLLGIWQKGEEEEAAKYGQIPGDPKVKDSYDIENHRYSDEDKEFLGTKTPKFRWSLRNDFTFLKNFTASINIYSQWGHKATFTDYINNDYTFERENVYVREYWTPDNPTNKFARLGATQKASGAPKIVDRSFIRLESISLSYDVPKNFLSRFDIAGLKFYANVRNVAVWTKEWYDWDPEVNRDSPGPLPRTFNFGVNLTF